MARKAKPVSRPKAQKFDAPEVAPPKPLADLPRGRKVHVVKCWPQFFEAIARGDKRGEMRVDDRDYQVGDEMIHQEFDPVLSSFSGREVRTSITHLFRPGSTPSFGVMPGWVCLSIELAEAPSRLVRALTNLRDATRTMLHSNSDEGLGAAIDAADVALGVVKR